MRESPKEFYAIEYELDGESKWAVFFNLECAQEAIGWLKLRERAKKEPEKR